MVIGNWLIFLLLNLHFPKCSSTSGTSRTLKYTLLIPLMHGEPQICTVYVDQEPDLATPKAAALLCGVMVFHFLYINEGEKTWVMAFTPPPKKKKRSQEPCWCCFFCFLFFVFVSPKALDDYRNFQPGTLGRFEPHFDLPACCEQMDGNKKYPEIFIW